MPLSDHTPPSVNGDGSNASSDPAWVVQKFGGTSVGKFAIKIVDHIVLYAISSVLLACFVVLY
jgi:aspartate kinase